MRGVTVLPKPHGDDGQQEGEEHPPPGPGSHPIPSSSDGKPSPPPPSPPPSPPPAGPSGRLGLGSGATLQGADRPLSLSRGRPGSGSRIPAAAVGLYYILRRLPRSPVC